MIFHHLQRLNYNDTYTTKYTDLVIDMEKSYTGCKNTVKIYEKHKKIEK